MTQIKRIKNRNSIEILLKDFTEQNIFESFVKSIVLFVVKS